MLHFVKNFYKNNKNVHFKKYFNISLFFVNKIIFIYSGKYLVKKKTCMFDLGHKCGNYVLTRKIYNKPDKFFKFKY